MSKISELVGDPHYTCYKPSSSNASNNVNDTISEFPCNGDPHWTAKTWPEKEIKANPNEYDMFKDAMKNVNNPLQIINQEINRPSHYGSKSGKDVIDWCEDFGIMNNAYIFNIFKYLCRAGKKNNNSELQDALKARIYLDRYIEKLEK